MIKGETKIKVLSTHYEDFSGYVYNLEVENTHTYIANNIIVHNCYMGSTPEDNHFDNIIGKAQKFFGNMSINERPFQLAIGGGNPNEHPDFSKFIEYIDSIGITPNYTTNGMGLSEEVLDSTAKYCGGVAISAHPHLEEYWKPAIDKLCAIERLVVNLHIIISDKESIDYFSDIYNAYSDKIKYFVLLPYEAMGRATPKPIDLEYLSIVLDNIDDISKVAFGAGFYEWLKTKDYPTFLYEPELLSGFLDMSNMKLYKSSFHLEEVPLPKVSNHETTQYNRSNY